METYKIKTYWFMFVGVFMPRYACMKMTEMVEKIDKQIKKLEDEVPKYNSN